MTNTRTSAIIPEPPFKSPQATARYGFALLASVLALILTYSLKPLSNHYVFDLFQGAVALTAFYAGLGPALMSAALSIIVLDFFFIPPLHTLSLGFPDLFRLAIFGAVAVLISSLSVRLRQAKADLEKAHALLEDRIVERTQELSTANANLTAEIASRLEAEKAILEITSREQRRLGQDLHDGLCQILAGAKLVSERIKNMLAAREQPEAQGLEMIESRLGEALAQADMISRGLYPVELDANGLMAALQELAVKLPRIYSVACRYKCTEPVSIHDSSIANHLYRMAQEAVMNAIKSGKAERITIQLRGRHAAVVLRVIDNGIGFQINTQRNGMGLKIMEYRARMINASLHYRSRRGGGTVVSCAFEQGINPAMSLEAADAV